MTATPNQKTNQIHGNTRNRRLTMHNLARITTHEPGSEAWREQRRTCLGGSEIAAVLGLSPWESRFSLWHRKTGQAQPKEDSPSMEWGRRLEPVVRDKWAETHAETHTIPEYGETFLRDGWMLASPDGITYSVPDCDHQIVEIKTAHHADDWGEPGTDQVPPYYLCQVRWYMGVLGLQRSHFAVLIGGSDYREYIVDQNDDDLALMVLEGRKFLDSIERGERPDIDAHSATYQTVRELHPDIDPEHVEIAPELAGEYVDSHLCLDAAKQRHQKASSRLLDAMGTSKHADLDGVRIAYRTARKRADGTPGTPYLQADKKTVATLTFTAKDAA